MVGVPAVGSDDEEAEVCGGRRRVLEPDDPPPKGVFCLGRRTLPFPFVMKSWKMCLANIWHMPGGYAAVGEVAKPP